jgi:hypothetical protein
MQLLANRRKRFQELRVKLPLKNKLTKDYDRSLSFVQLHDYYLEHKELDPFLLS